MEVLETTESICPDCLKEGKTEKIDAEIVEEEGKVWIKKECRDHGEFEEIMFSNPHDYRKWKKYEREGDGVKNVRIEDLSLYDEHKSQSVLTNLTVTNRCNLRCSYCFLNAGSSGYVYEPSLDEIEGLLEQARNMEPVGSRAIQITGGEPTVRDDLFEIIEMADEKGFAHIQVNTNGIKLAESKEYVRKIHESAANSLYLSFDGVSKETNPWIDANEKVIENTREVGMRSVVLVPVVSQNNLHEVGDIIRFAQENIDVVRGVNFQPIAFTGRIDQVDDEYRKKQRVDYSEMMEAIDKQLGGEIESSDWYPVPFVYPVSKLVENIKNEKQVEFTANPSCGGATYAFVEDGELIPITRFVDVEGLMEYLEELSEKEGPMKKARIMTSMMTSLSDFVDSEKTPRGLSLKKLLAKAIVSGDYSSLGEFHHEALYIGSMWFQDAWNLDLDRLSSCVIHYTTPEGMVPFCAYNGLGVGKEIRERHSKPVEEWEDEEGKSIKDDLWENGPIS
ncbi:MAG: tetraether lipid synthase Tes [Candidatus Aenigmatarchaeota archaeon]